MLRCPQNLCSHRRVSVARVVWGIEKGVLVYGCARLRTKYLFISATMVNMSKYVKFLFVLPGVLGVLFYIECCKIAYSRTLMLYIEKCLIKALLAFRELIQILSGYPEWSIRSLSYPMPRKM